MIQTLIKIATYLAANNQKLPIVYIAGKVTGLPYAEVWSKFQCKQIELEGQGFYVLNPLNHIDEHENWQTAMKISVIMLACSRHICFLPDWHLSNGATLERSLSIPLGINSIED